MKNLIFVALITLLIGACTKAQRFVKRINEGPTTVELVKDPTRVKNNIIVKDTDGLFYAIDMSYSGSNTYDYYINNRVNVTYAGNGYYTDGTNLYETHNASSKDLEQLAAFGEKLKKEHMVEFYALELGLNDQRAQAMASLTTAWEKARSKREMTAQDLNAFSKKAFGLPYKNLESAMVKYQEGQMDELNTVIEKAADFNEISPEHMRSIVNDLMDL
ncbi:MAG: hypothetical protein OEY33_01430 [Bdellovibrionales bacterium]|nr:hypothetical protein [Bdellovibrionales bacterium]